MFTEPHIRNMPLHELLHYADIDGFRVPPDIIRDYGRDLETLELGLEDAEDEIDKLENANELLTQRNEKLSGIVDKAMDVLRDGLSV